MAIKQPTARAVKRLARAASSAIAEVSPGLPKRLVPPGSGRRAAYDRLVRSASEDLSPAPQPPYSAGQIPDVSLAVTECPVVSIIVTSWNNIGHTLRCLASIGASCPKVPYEVIVVDDASTDADVLPQLRSVGGIRLIALSENVGYLRATNEGWRHARGNYIALLNNDIQVIPGWLDALTARIESAGSVGVVGARLVYPNGSLQEAGAIIWSDGTGWNYGNGEPPDRSEYRYVREPDYVSAACLLVRRAIGPFDERYAPAFFEDVDLCFRARESGYTVVYEPLATAIHHEGLSYGRNVAVGLKQHQVRNREVFRERWGAELKRQNEPDPRAVPRARDRRNGPRILVIDHKLPAPDADSGSVRLTAMLELFVERGHPVHFMPSDLVFNDRYARGLEARGIEVLATSASARRFFGRLGGDVRLCILARPLVATGHLKHVRRHCPEAIVAYDMVDLHALRMTRLAEQRRSRPDARMARRIGGLESRCIREADVVIAVTEEERRYAETLRGGRTTYCIPNIHEPAASGPVGPDASRRDVLFVGGFDHLPNVDAVEWIVGELAPMLARRLPGVNVRVVGRGAPQALIEAAPENVVFDGWLPSLESAYSSARVVLAPLRTGAGMKGKVGEAMAQGVPVVTTSVGAEGYGSDAREFLQIEDDETSIVRAIVGLFEDDDLWATMARRGHEYVLRELSVAVARERVERLLGDLWPSDAIGASG